MQIGNRTNYILYTSFQLYLILPLIASRYMKQYILFIFENYKYGNFSNKLIMDI